LRRVGDNDETVCLRGGSFDADEKDFCSARGYGQQRFGSRGRGLVLQQYYGAGLSSCALGDEVGAAIDCGGARLVDIRLLEKAELKFLQQDAAGGLANALF
jgi:hypothetical protein